MDARTQMFFFYGSHSHWCSFYGTPTSPDPISITTKIDIGESMTISWGDGTTDVVNGTGASVTTTHSYVADQHNITADPSSNTALLTFAIYSNQLTGSAPDISSNTALANLYLNSNQFTGSLPSISSNIALLSLYAYSNQFTGLIPDISSNIKIQNFDVHDNQLTDVAAGFAVPTERSFDFNASNNALTETAVNAILVAFDTANPTAIGTINLSGGTNAAPTGAGATAAASLIAKGWTVTTN